MWLVTFSFVLILPQYQSTSDWIKCNNEDCPNCLIYVADTNFTAIISFESKVLLGARNSIYQINFLEESSDKFEDKYQPEQFETCKNKFGQKVEDCQNYYKVILRLNPSDLFICGTAAYNPICMVRTKSDLSYSTQIGDGIGICPANPRASTTYLKLKDSIYGFAGTERASSNEYAISLINLRYGSYQVEATTKSNNHWLKKPDFVYSFEHGDYVYFILKEIAVEVLTIEQIYSRIVRICKDDRGGANPFFNKNFMTFLKARLFCSYTKAGQSPYDFNEIGGAYYLDGYLYGLFSGPSTVIDTGSVLCKFDMENIAKVFNGKAKYFEHGAFHDEKEPKPFSCVEGRGRSTIDATANQLMANAITASSPIFYSQLQMQRLTVSRVTVDGETSLVAHAGTLTGFLIRIGFKSELEYEGTVRHRQLKLGKGPVLELSVAEDDDEQVFVMSHNWVGYVPLHSPCHIHTTCQSCQSSFPNCGWCKHGGMNNQCTTKVDCIGQWDSPYSTCPALPSFNFTPRNKSVTLTEDQPVKEVEFRCKSRQRDIKPTWTKLSGQISTSAKYLEEGNVLKIRTERYTDTGTYICNLQGEAGNVQAMATLTVKVSPTFTHRYVPNITVAPGDDVIFTCRSDGNPKPTTMWFKKGSVNLPEGAKQEPSGDLKIIRTVSQDAGSYYCQIDNGVGNLQRSRDILLIVTSEPNDEEISDPPDPFDYKNLIIGVSAVIIVIVIIGGLVHLFIKKRKCQKAHQAPHAIPYTGITYHEQAFVDYPHTPSSIITPDYLEEQNMQYRGSPFYKVTMTPGMINRHVQPKVHFEWGQQIPLPHAPHLLPPRRLSELEEEPPPAYHAEIELHQPPIPVRRPLNAPEHFFTPVVASGGGGARTDTPPSSGYSTARSPERGPTPPSRTNVVNSPPSRMMISPDTSEQEDITSAENMLLEQGDSNNLSDDTTSCHEYEHIGLLNNDNNLNNSLNSDSCANNNNISNNNPSV